MQDERQHGAVRLTTPVNFIDLAVSELEEEDIESLKLRPLANISIEMELPDGTRRRATTSA